MGAPFANVRKVLHTVEEVGVGAAVGLFLSACWFWMRNAFCEFAEVLRCGWGLTRRVRAADYPCGAIRYLQITPTIHRMFRDTPLGMHQHAVEMPVSNVVHQKIRH